MLFPVSWAANLVVFFIPAFYFQKSFFLFWYFLCLQRNAIASFAQNVIKYLLIKFRFLDDGEIKG